MPFKIPLAISQPIRSALVVDDNEDAAELLCEHLSSKGIEAVPAYDAEGAWAKAVELRPDLVLLDIELPDENGDVVARRLREAGLARVIVAMTGYRGRIAKELVEQGGFDGFIPKPCPLWEIDKLLGFGVSDDERERCLDRRAIPRPSSS